MSLTWSNDALLITPSGVAQTSGPPALVVFNSILYCFHEGAGGSGWLWLTTWDGSGWSADQLVPDSYNALGTSGPPAVAVFNGLLYCVREGRGNSGWTWCATFDGSTWTTDQLLPDNAQAFGTSGPPSLAVLNGRLYCVREGAGDSGQVWCASFDGTTWTPDALLPDSLYPYGTSGPPALAAYEGKLYCVRQGSGNTGWTWAASYDGTVWSVDTLIPNLSNAYGVTGWPGLGVFNNQLWCFREGRGASGWLWGGVLDGTVWSNDQPIPNVANPIGINGPPAVCAYRAEGGPEQLFLVHEGRGGDGQLWFSIAS